jgi:hypothetical protein
MKCFTDGILAFFIMISLLVLSVVLLAFPAVATCYVTDTYGTMAGLFTLLTSGAMSFGLLGVVSNGFGG